MKLRPAKCCRKLTRPWTRVSKRKPRKSYVKGVPKSKIVRFEMGKKGDYDTNVAIISKESVQIRHNALEAIRISVNKSLIANIGKDNYFFKILIYPHQVLREHKLATGAGADRRHARDG